MRIQRLVYSAPPFFLVLLLSWFFASPQLLAQGNLTFQLGGADAGPMVGNPAAIFWNPAALGLMPVGTHVLVDIEVAGGQGQYERAPDLNSSFYPQVDASVIFPIPFIGLVDDFGIPDWRFGFAAYVPFGSGGSWDPNGPQRFHLSKGAEGSLFMTASATYKVTPKFFIGAGVSYIFSALQGETSLDLVSTVQGLVPGSLSSLPIESPLFEAQAVTSLMTAHNIGFNGGVFFQPVPYVDLGLSFLLPVNITYRGTVDITLPDVLTLGQPALSTIGFDGRTVTADGEISTLRPGMIMGGISWRSTEALTMDTVFIFSFNSQRSSFKTELFNTGLPYLDAPEGTSIRLTGADNAYQARFGAKYRFNPTLMTGGYITYIDAGIPSAYVTASNIGFNLLIPTWLLEYAYEPESKFACSFSPIFALPRTVSDSAFNSLLPANSGLGIPTGNGDYRGFGVQLGLSYTQHF